MSTIDTGTTDLLCDIAGGVATLTFNRPEAKNALSNPMSQGLIKMLKHCNEDAAVRVILLTGAGGAFCAGGDVKNMGDRRSPSITPDERLKEMKTRHRGVGGQIVASPKPTIAAVAGPAVGAGLAIALACDIRIAGQSAFLSGGYSKIGLSGDYGLAGRVSRRTTCGCCSCSSAASSQVTTRSVGSMKAVRVLFVHARDPGKVVVLDTETGKVVTTMVSGGMVDDAVFDPKLRRLYVTGVPFINVFEKSDEGDRYDLLGQVPTAFHSITAFLIPEMNRYYLAVNHHGTTDAVVQVYRVVP